MNKRIYLDNNATTGIDPRVLEVMLPELSPTPANPSSAHFFGQKAKQKLQNAREKIAAFLNVKPQEIFFTSGGTEAMNLLLRGQFADPLKAHAISSNVEHSCVYQTLLGLGKKGWDVTYLPAGLIGAVQPDQVKQAIRPQTQCIALTAVNSETGVKHDLDAIGQIALNASIPLIVDGVGWLGKEQFTIHPGVTAMAFAAHKIHGPKGVGFAFIRSGLKLFPQITGGNQEYGLRAGTENLPGILGLSKAIELLKTELPAATHRMAMLRDRFETALKNQNVPFIVNGTGPRICNTSNLAFPEELGEDLLIALDRAGVATSHGSACSSGAMEPSRILTQMGVPFEIAKTALRFSLSRDTTLEEIDQTVAILSAILTR